MAIDTKNFDDAITVKETAVQVAQAAVDADVFVTEQKAAQAKANKLADEQNAKALIENKKAQFVSIQTQIDTKTQEISDLTQQAEDLKASI